MANLAAIKLQGGASRQARTLFEQALKLPAVWSGKTDAEADLALTLILEGDNTNGLALLLTAQNHFHAANDLPGLLSPLRNEADYWSVKENSDKSEAVKKRMQAIEATGTDPGPAPAKP